MYILYFIAISVMAFRLKKMMSNTAIYEEWKPWFNLSWGIWILFVVVNALLKDAATNIVGWVLLLVMLRYLTNLPDFKPFRFYIDAHYPLLAVGVIDIATHFINRSFYKEYEHFFLLAMLAAFGWIYMRWLSSKKQRDELEKANRRNTELDRLVMERTAELTKQRNELQETVKLLQATQAQLIQQEKLASLGELTAGIAHEIQNPLNFVNNFSEVSMELIDEMEEELNKGDTAEAMAIASDIKQNLGKIIHHGKRADGIVKGMLQHSRAAGDEKELTDVNKLADEYLRLSYHGLRAKDKSFNAELITHFDEGLPQVKLVAQDIGRVLLNLFNNAFYAVNQRKKTAESDYKPAVSVTTTAGDGCIVVLVRDNGTGIPDEIREKIMQPFFTTKPTGEGTGLGLSLSYDIVVKGHGGKIDITSEEGAYTQFEIRLPI
jgi:signal transduction histidine kinase